MKRKQSFVTNSSSSSFIVAWDKKITKDDLGYIIKFIENPTYANIILDDSLRFKPIQLIDNNLRKFIKMFQEQDGFFDRAELDIEDKFLDIVRPYYKKLASDSGIPENEKNNIRKELNRIYSEENDRVANLRKDRAKQFFNENKDKYVYRYCYSDNDGALFSIMEHGNIFKSLPNIRFNNH